MILILNGSSSESHIDKSSLPTKSIKCHKNALSQISLIIKNLKNILPQERFLASDLG